MLNYTSQLLTTELLVVTSFIAWYSELEILFKSLSHAVNGIETVDQVLKSTGSFT